jgi:hypothetical protein
MRYFSFLFLLFIALACESDLPPGERTAPPTSLAPAAAPKTDAEVFSADCQGKQPSVASGQSKMASSQNSVAANDR